MKGFSQFKLKKLILLFVVGAIFLLYYAFPVYYDASHVQAQLQLQQQQPPPIMGIKITSPVANQVPVGELTISGISTDNATTDCTVYTDWNNTKPFQKAVATGPGGVDDYSTWNFTYTDKYYLITNGTNNLTSKLSCINNNDGGTANLTTYYSLDVTGIMESSQRQLSSAAVEEQQNNHSNSSVSSSSTLPPAKGDNNNDTKTVTTTTATSPESIPSVPITPSPGPSSSPSIQGQEEKNKEKNKDVSKEEPEPEPEPQSTTSLSKDDKTTNTVKQGKKIEEAQVDEKVQEQLQQMLEKTGKIDEEVQQTVGKLKEDILEEIRNGLK
jgi:hypothetical protein